MIVRLERRLAPLVGVLSVLFVALALAQNAEGAAVSTAVAAVAAVAAGSLLAARYAATVLRRRMLTVSARSPRHRESVDRMVEPSHPLTRGRRRPRAPGRVSPAA